MKKGKPLVLITILAWLFTIILSPVFILGYTLYILSKLMRSLGFIMILRKHSARDEFAGFWRVNGSIKDIF